MDRITARQEQVLEIITRYINEYGYPPTLRDIGKQLSVSGTLGVMKHLDALEKKGYLRRQEGSSRGISLCSQAQGQAQAASLPIVGVVRAGALHPAIEDIEGHFAIDRSQLRSGGTFFLRVKGDSMIHAHIKEGDLALVRPQPTAANRDYSAIIIREGDGELSIIGKVVGIYRRME